jgi:hypothetical protein
MLDGFGVDIMIDPPYPASVETINSSMMPTYFLTLT